MIYVFICETSYAIQILIVPVLAFYCFKNYIEIPPKGKETQLSIIIYLKFFYD